MTSGAVAFSRTFGRVVAASTFCLVHSDGEKRLQLKGSRLVTCEETLKSLHVHVLIGGQGGSRLAGWNHLSEEDRKVFARHARPEIRFTFGPEPVADTHILVTAFPSHEQLQASGPRLRAMVIPFAGLPANTRQVLLSQGWVAKGLQVHNIHHNAPMTAEMAVALGLAAAKQLIPADHLLRKGDWSARGIPSDGDPIAMPQLPLEGSTAVVLGYGEVGRRVARAMAGMGMRVLALRRSEPPGGRLPDAGEVVIRSHADLHALLPQAQMLFVCVPDTAETTGLLGPKELSCLPPGAVLVNVGRGHVVDEEALYQALQSGRLLGAGIDTWYQYPLDVETRACTPVSSKYDFGALPNLVLSPHRGGAIGIAHTEAARMRALAELCNAAVDGGFAAMPNRVDVETGY